MKIVMCLAIWIVSGMLATTLMGGVARLLDRRFGYDWKERGRIESRLYDEWVDLMESRGLFWSIIQLWVIPAVLWPYHLVATVARISIQATNEMTDIH